MSVKEINGNSIFEIAKKQAVRNKKAVEVANRINVQSEEGLVPVDNSFDDFNLTADELSGNIFQLVSQYKKLSGVMEGVGRKGSVAKAKGGATKGGAFSNETNVGLYLGKRVESTPHTEPQIIGKWADDIDDELNTTNPSGDRLHEIMAHIDHLKTIITEDESHRELVSIIKVIVAASEARVIDPTPPPSPKDGAPAVKPKGGDDSDDDDDDDDSDTSSISFGDIDSFDPDRDFKLNFTNDGNEIRLMYLNDIKGQLDNIDDVDLMKKILKDSSLMHDILNGSEDTEKYFDINERNDAGEFVNYKNRRELQKMIVTLEEIVVILNYKIGSFQATRTLREASSSSTIGGILSDIVKIINKMIQVLKNKRLDWKRSIVSKDLVEVMDKIKEHYKNITNINDKSDVMDDYKDAYGLAFIRISELRTLFIQLVKSSNSAGLVGGGVGGSRASFYDGALK